MKKLLLIISLVLTFAGCITQDAAIYDDLATCITDSGAIMYGTEWCPHCKDQKEAFGSSFENINYIDCDKDKQTCTDAGITGYPTWIMGDGEHLIGTQSIAVLADKTACELPTNE
jgi:glutaredoxin